MKIWDIIIGVSFFMALSSYRIQRIYLAATMNYGLGSNDPEELAYYKRYRQEIDDMRSNTVKKGIPQKWNIHDGIDKLILILFYYLM